jgi:protein O-mannosyl-transferase
MEYSGTERSRAELSKTEQGHSLFDLSRLPPLWRRWLPWMLFAAAVLIVYGSAVHFGFVSDDFDYIVENYQIQGLSLRRFVSIWSYPFAYQYAPLHLTLLSVLYSVFGLSPAGYHAAQLLLHFACVGLLYATLKDIASARVALLATLLFAVYPPNTETVAWISETKTTLAFLFFLLSFRAYMRLRAQERWRDGIWCAVFLILSLLVKINTVVAPAIFLLYDYKQGDPWTKRRALTLAPFFAISAALAGWTLRSFASSTQFLPERLIEGVLAPAAPSMHRADWGNYYGGPWVHLLNLPRLLAFYVRMIFLPSPLSVWHMMQIDEAISLSAVFLWLACLALGVVLVRSSRNVRFWALWFLIFLAPALQLIPNATWVADRYLYIPAIGAFVLLSELFFHLSDRLRASRARCVLDAVMIAILAAFAWQSVRHLSAWRDDVSLWAAALPHCQTSALCHSRLGTALLRAGQPERAVAELRRAVEIRPGLRYRVALGDAYTDGTGDYRQAIATYLAARQAAGPLPAPFWAKLAKAYYLSGDLDRATEVIQSIGQLDPGDPSVALVDIFVQWKQGHVEAARRSLRVVMQSNHFYPGTPADFLNHYWGRPDEVRRMLADVGTV